MMGDNGTITPGRKRPAAPFPERVVEVHPMTTAAQLQDLLGLKSPPVAITFRATAPADVPRVAAAGPSSCTYWKAAAQGQVFYTEAADHYHCPIGAYTHGVDLPPADQQELQGVVGTMSTLGYIRSEEVPNIPRREER